MTLLRFRTRWGAFGACIALALALSGCGRGLQNSLPCETGSACELVTVSGAFEREGASAVGDVVAYEYDTLAIALMDTSDALPRWADWREGQAFELLPTTKSVLADATALGRATNVQYSVQMGADPASSVFCLERDADRVTICMRAFDQLGAEFAAAIPRRLTP